MSKIRSLPAPSHLTVALAVVLAIFALVPSVGQSPAAAAVLIAQEHSGGHGGGSGGHGGSHSAAGHDSGGEHGGGPHGKGKGRGHADRGTPGTGHSVEDRVFHRPDSAVDDHGHSDHEGGDDHP